MGLSLVHILRAEQQHQRAHELTRTIFSNPFYFVWYQQWYQQLKPSGYSPIGIGRFEFPRGHQSKFEAATGRIITGASWPGSACRSIFGVQVVLQVVLRGFDSLLGRRAWVCRKRSSTSITNSLTHRDPANFRPNRTCVLRS